MKKLIYTCIVATMLSGCQMSDWVTAESDPPPSNLGVDKNGRLSEAEPMPEESKVVEMRGDNRAGMRNTYMADSNFQSQSGGNFQVGGQELPTWSQAHGTPMVKNINHYVRGIMHSLVDNIHYINDKTPIGVASFIYLDGAYNHSNLLGNQIAESFMHEVHQFGIPVIDYKTTDYIRVTEGGDFIFSRDFLELKDELPIKYVLAGTMVKHQAGILVNARIIGLTSKAIVASAQGFIPNTVAEALMPSAEHDGIMLIQGD